MNINPNRHKRTRYERVKSLRDQAIEDGLTDKMWQATYLLQQLEQIVWSRINQRNELITRLRQDTSSC
jgi:uncharacterized caspase-like protein